MSAFGRKTFLGLGVATVAAVIWVGPAAWASCGHCGKDHDKGGKKEHAAAHEKKGPDMHKMAQQHMQAMADVQGLLKEANAALADGKAELASSKVTAAMARLKKHHKQAHHHMAGMHGEGEKMKCAFCAQMKGEMAEAKVVNSKCPMMGGKLDRANVPDKLTREFKGKTVGFCCAACPAHWDKLTDAQKQKKLQAVLATSGDKPKEQEHEGHH